MFNLEEFKKGVPALTLDGQKRYYVGINPRKHGTSVELVTVDDNGNIHSYYISGNYFGGSCNDNYLAEMYREPKTYWINIYKSKENDGLLIGSLNESFEVATFNSKHDPYYIKTIEVKI